MRKGIVFLLVLVVVSTGCVSAKGMGFSADELADLLNVIYMIKIPFEAKGNPAVELWVEIYRNDHPVSVEALDHTRMIEPEIEFLGQMRTYPQREKSQWNFMLVMQSLDNHLKVIWGVEEFFEGQSSSSRVNGELSIAELASREYHWMRRGFSIDHLTYNEAEALYTFTGSKKRDGTSRHTSYRSDDLQIQAQLHDVLVVLMVKVTEE